MCHQFHNSISKYRNFSAEKWYLRLGKAPIRCKIWTLFYEFIRGKQIHLDFTKIFKKRVSVAGSPEHRSILLLFHHSWRTEYCFGTGWCRRFVSSHQELHLQAAFDSGANNLEILYSDMQWHILHACSKDHAQRYVGISKFETVNDCSKWTELAAVLLLLDITSRFISFWIRN